MTTEIPKTIGRYEIVGHLATGGMAEILLARLRGPSGFERPVVLKRILPHLAEKQNFVDMFLDEARIASGIQHKNVVQVIDLGHSGEHLYLVMEYLEGENVGALIKRSLVEHQPIPYALSAFILAETCAGLHAAHELEDDQGRAMGLVHRDVSPQNVFVTYPGAVKVLDFGIAKADARVAQATEAGQLKGKLDYMSPEQALGRPLDRRTDVFAAGVVLYELAARRRLFNRATVLETLEAICRQPITPPRRVVSDLPVSLERIIVKALERDPDARYATALEMRQDLLGVVVEQMGAADAEQRLASLMSELFSQRMADKRELLRRVRSGDAAARWPDPEPDPTYDIPDLLVPRSVRPPPPAAAPAAPPPIALALEPKSDPGAVHVPAASPDHYDGSHAELEIAVGEAVARFGMAGTVLVEGNRARLVGAGPEVETELGAGVAGFERLAPEVKQRRATELARRLVQERRARLAGTGGGSGFRVPRFVAPLVVLLLGAVALGFAYRWLAPGGWSFSSTPAASASAVSADDYERQRAERAQRVCDATRSRIVRGASIGPTDVEGWVVELVLARPTPAPEKDAALDAFIERGSASGGKFVWKEAPEIASQEGIGSEVGVRAEAVSGSASAHAVRLTFNGKYATPYFYAGDRKAYLKLANALSEKLGATHGALFARCALGTTHHLGAWFLGPSPGGAATALLYWIGANGDPPQIRQSVLEIDAGDRSGVFTRIDDKTKALERNKLRAVIGEHEGMISGKGDGPTTLTFPFADSNRAARASLEVARVAGVGVER
ncbi:MAG: serine/threonine-protein kinase [Polyangiaceae bacterium]